MTTVIGGVVTGTSQGETIDMSDWFAQALSNGIMRSNGLGGNDTINGTTYVDQMKGGDGNDVLNGGGGNDIIEGGIGDDTITASFGNTTLKGDQGIDTIIGGTDADFIYGGTENDVLDGGLGNDLIYGEDGNDEIAGGLGYDELSGGAGNDTFLLRGNNISEPNYDLPGGRTTFYSDDDYDGGAGLGDLLVADENNLTLVMNNIDVLAPDSIEGITGSASVNFRVLFLEDAEQNFTGFSLSNVKLAFSGGDDLISGVGIESAGVTVDGGYGTDTIKINANYSSAYTVNLIGNGQILVSYTDSGTGITKTLNLQDVERIQFNNQTLDFAPANWQDTDATGGTAIDGIAGTISESANTGAMVGIDLSVDPSSLLPGEPVTYSIVDEPNVYNGSTIFAIDPITGVVTLANASLLDYESAPLINGGPERGYSILVEATAGGISSARTFTILVTDGNDRPDAPVDSDAGTADSVMEGAANGAYTGITAQASDPNGDPVTYSLFDNAGGRFAINATTGAITVLNGALLDYETASSHNVTVRATDSLGASSADSVFTIYLDDFAGDIPIDADAATYDAVDEGAATGAYAGVTAYSVSPWGGAITYSLTNNAGGRFAIDPISGAITVMNGALLDHETDAYWIVTVRASDGSALNDQDFYIYLNDVIVESWTGTSGAEAYTVYGGGNWVLSGLGGSDVLTGGFGDDILIGGDGNDTLNGMTGHDLFQFSGSTGGMDYVVGGEGYDMLQATADGTIIGLASLSGVEEIWGGGFVNVTLQLGGGDDTIDPGVTTLSGVQAIRAGAGADTIIGTAGDETIFGEDGNDFIFGGEGADALSGGNGIDTVSYAGSIDALTINLATNAVSGGDATGDTISGFENVIATDHNDTITGSITANTITGGYGDDVMDGGDGNDLFLIGLDSGVDSIIGGNGTDTVRFVENNAVLALSSIATVNIFDASGVTNARITGTSGNDTLSFANTTMTNVAGIYGLEGNDTLTGSSSADIVIGGAGDDTINTSSGNDIIRYEGGDEGFDALNGSTGTDTVEATGAGVTIGLRSITAIEQINGYGDTIILGSTGANTLNFSAVTMTGIALIDGGAGNDTITGSSADDTIRGGTGTDILNGGAGNDTFLVTGAGEALDTYNGGAGYDSILAQTDSTTIYLGTTISGIEEISANGYSGVKIAGGSANDVWDFSGATLTGMVSISAESGNDTVIGSASVDSIFGKVGNDVLDGGGGNDRLTGGNDADTLTGGTGNDIFDFNLTTESGLGVLADRITDFTQGQDKIDLGTIDANTLLTNNQAFTFVGAGAFTSVAGQLRFDNSLGDGLTHIFGDVNGDGAADFEIKLTGTYALISTDFIL